MRVSYHTRESLDFFCFGNSCPVSGSLSYSDDVTHATLLLRRLLRSSDVDDWRNPADGAIFQDTAVRPEAMDCDWYLHLGGDPVHPRLHVLLVHIPEEAQQVVLRQYQYHPGVPDSGRLQGDCGGRGA